jgi:hypothetical protein
VRVRTRLDRCFDGFNVVIKMEGLGMDTDTSRHIVDGSSTIDRIHRRSIIDRICEISIVEQARSFEENPS